MDSVDQLILDLAQSNRNVTDQEIELLRQHVAAAGFDPTAREQVRGRLVGVSWQGRQIQSSRELLPPAELKYLWHVVKRQEWPDGTTLDQYVESIKQVVLDPQSGILTSRYMGAWSPGILRQSRDLRGVRGFDWVLVQYRVSRGYWVTAFQPELGLAELLEPEWSDVKWLRYPQQSVLP